MVVDPLLQLPQVLLVVLPEARRQLTLFFAIASHRMLEDDSTMVTTSPRSSTSGSTNP